MSNNHHDHNTDDHRNEQVEHTPTTSDDMSLALIEEQADKNIRRDWHEGQWYFSVIDVIALLTESPRPRKYWSDLKASMRTSEGWSQLLTRCRQLKMLSSDKKFYITDCADFATIVALVHLLPALRRAERKPSTSSSATACGGIYTIVNTLTKEQYIGSSGDIPARFSQHKALLRRGKHHASRLQEAWNSYGEDAFLFVVLEEIRESEALEAVEQYYLNTEQPTYNGAAIANNMLSLKPISEERIQQVILTLYDLQSATTQAPLLQTLRDALVYGVIKPGPNFQALVQAEAEGIATWEDFSVFIQQQVR